MRPQYTVAIRRDLPDFAERMDPILRLAQRRVRP